MAEADYDVVVVGAGFAGLCCAGTLVTEGLRVCLVSEMPEVGWNLRPKVVEGNVGFIQYPVWQVAWDGGWWFPLVRKLNVPCRFELVPTVDVIVRGSEGGPKELTFCASAAGLAEVLAEVSPIPLDAEARRDLERLLDDALRMDWRELMAMGDVPLCEWLRERDLNPMVQGLLYVFGGNILESTPDVAAAHCSVLGVLTPLRAFGCAEVQMTMVKPDVWTGLLVPMGQAIEQRGATILRGKKAAQVIFEADQAVGVSFRDGSEVRAKTVAIATGTSRVPALLPSMPKEVNSAVEYAAQIRHEDVCIYAILNEPVVTSKHYAIVVDGTGANLEFFSPQHALAPWSTQPGKQFIVAQSCLSPKEMAEAGGGAAVADRMVDLNNEIFPGFKNAIEAIATQHHRHLHHITHTHGPKLPRTSKELAGVWFVGDGSAPVVGMGMEAAAGAGVLGARAIVESLRRHERSPSAVSKASR